MPFEKGTSVVALKRWKSTATLEDSLVDKIKYFHGFSTYSDDEGVWKPSAIFVTSDDEVYAVGYNASDNLLALEGDNFARNIDLEKPLKINGLSGKKIKKLAVSERFGAALSEDGDLIYWGTRIDKVPGEKRDKSYVQLPHFPQPKMKLADFGCGGHSITCLTNAGFIRVWGCINTPYYEFYDFQPIFLKKGRIVTTLAVGWYHSAVLDDKGKVWTFGIGSAGELGYEWQNRSSLGSFPKCEKVELPRKCVKVQCGSNSTIFLLENGDVYACGNNLQLDHLCVGKTGHIFQPVQVLLDDPIADIMAAYNFSGNKYQSRFAAVSEKGEFFKWGEEKNEKGPSKVSGINSLAEMYVNFKTPQEYGVVIQKGGDSHQDTGHPSKETEEQNIVVPEMPKLVPGENIGPLTEGNALSCLPAGNTVELGPSSGYKPQRTEHRTMSREPAPRSLLSKWPLLNSIEKRLAEKIMRFMVFSGYDYIRKEEALGAFVVTLDDDVFSFGINTDERLLGLSGTIAHENIVQTPTKVESLSGKNIKKIVVGMNYGAALSKDGPVFVWNKQSGPTLLETEGEIPVDIACGSGFILVLTERSNIFQMVEIYSEGAFIFDYELKNNQKIIMPTDVKVESIECGDLHGGFVTTNGDVYTFGDGIYDQLGYPQDRPAFLDQAKKVAFDYPCAKIACGVGYTAFLLVTGDVYACGSKVYDIEIGEEESIVIPERISIPEPVIDLVSATRCIHDGRRVTWFLANTATGAIYMWTEKNPKTVNNVTSSLGAFDGLPIPQSMSLVNLECREDGKQKSDQTYFLSKETTAGEEDEQDRQEKFKFDGSSDNTYGDESVGNQAIAADEKSDVHSSNEAGNFQKAENPIKILLEDPRYSDLMIKFSNASIPAHKVLLYTKSPFFRRAISKKFDIDDLDMSAYKPKPVLALLKHIYELPIGDKASIQDAADFHEFTKNDGNTSSQALSEQLLYSSTINDTIRAHLDKQSFQLKEKILEAILPTKPFP